MIIDNLIRTMDRQEKAIARVLDIVARQREAMKTNDLNLVSDLLRDLDSAQNEAIASEVERDKEVKSLADKMECDATVASLSSRLGEEEAAALDESALRLEKVVKLAKADMSLLKTLVDESRSLNDMMLSEWRRLGGSEPRSGLDLKG